MVDLTFESRAKHLVPLTLLKRIANMAPGTISDDVNYIGLDGCKSIKGIQLLFLHGVVTTRFNCYSRFLLLLEMDLIAKGRLSVQRVSEEAWTTVQLLADTGGWDEKLVKKQRSQKRSAQSLEEGGENGTNIQGTTAEGSKKPSTKRKRKAAADGNEEGEEQSQRKVTRSRKS